MRRFVIISFCMCFMNSHAFESEGITDCIAIYYLEFIGRNQIHSLEDSILLKSFLGLICVILGVVLVCFKIYSYFDEMGPYSNANLFLFDCEFKSLNSTQYDQCSIARNFGNVL